MLDCASGDYWGNLGCDGGNEAFAYQYLMSSYTKLEWEDDYPYEEYQQRCRAPHSQNGVRLGDVWALHEKDVSSLKAALYHSGPVNVGLSAENDKWYDYKGGIVDWADCGLEPDHAVVAVGWGVDSSAGDYLIIKNSWTTDWGEQGYFRISLSQKYNSLGICGVLTDFSQACVGKGCIDIV